MCICATLSEEEATLPLCMLYCVSLWFVYICVLQVTHNQLNVLDLSWLDEGLELTQEELEPLSRNMAVSLQQLIDQREKANEVIRLTQQPLPGRYGHFIHDDTEYNLYI